MTQKKINAKSTLAKGILANTILWALSIVALIFVLEGNSSPKGIFVLLAAGLAVSLSMYAIFKKGE